MIIWIVGKSSSGKTTIGSGVCRVLNNSGQPWVLLDGDVFRALFGDDVDHTFEGRKKNSSRIANFCMFLDSQGVNVIVPVLSIFEEDRKKVRDSVGTYFEVYLKVADTLLRSRDNKNVYQRDLSEEVGGIVGVDIPFPEPENPDLIIRDDGSRSPETLVDCILQALPIDIPSVYNHTQRNLVLSPISYQYSIYYGVRYLNEFRLSRDLVCPIGAYSDFSNAALLNLLSDAILPRVEKVRQKNDFTQLVDLFYHHSEVVLNSLIKSFEVRKRVYDDYRENFLPAENANYLSVDGYLIALFVLCRGIENQKEPGKKLFILNAFLKLMDTLVSSIDKSCEGQLKPVAIGVEFESRFLKEYS